MDGDPTPALTGRRRTRPPSPGCRNPQQPEPGRAPLISAKPAVQSNRATSEHNCINLRLPSHGGVYAWEFEKGGRELKVRVEGQFTFNATGQILNAALAGSGLAYVPETMVQRYLAKGRLKRVLEDWCLPYTKSH